MKPSLRENIRNASYIAMCRRAGELERQRTALAIALRDVLNRLDAYRDPEEAVSKSNPLERATNKTVAKAEKLLWKLQNETR